MSVTRDGLWLSLDLGARMPVLSWSINRPGFVRARRIVWREVRNADLPVDLDVKGWFARELAARGESDAVGLLTSRDIGTYSVAGAEVEGLRARCVATVGLSNGERIGTRTDYSKRNWEAQGWGTINVAVHLNAGLTQAALIETLSVAAQARTAAVMDAGALVPAGVITGTGTDCIAVAAPEGAGEYAGLHTAAGEAVGRAVYDAVSAGALDWRRAYPAAPGLALEGL